MAVAPARAALLVAAPLLALTACTAFPWSGSQDVITRFHVDSTVLPDGTFEVTETITYDFGDEPSPGLWRDIPTSAPHSWLRARDLVITGVEATSPSGAPAEIERLRERPGRVEVEIGDEDAPVTGAQTYEISYTVHGALTQEDGYAGLHWDFVGDEWGVRVRDVRATVAAPEVAGAGCYYLRTVSYGDDEDVVEAECASEHDDTTATLTHDVLGPEMPLSGVVRVPDGTVEVADPSYTLPGWLVPPRWLTLVGVLSLAVSLAACYGMSRLYTWTHGVRVARRGLPPELPDLPPAVAGFLYRGEKLRPEHLLAGLVRLEEQGLIASHSGENGWVFTRNPGGAATGLSDRALLKLLFLESDTADLASLSRALTEVRVAGMRGTLNRECRKHGLTRSSGLWFLGCGTAALLLVPAIFTPYLLNEFTPVDVEGMTAFSTALPVITALTLLLPNPLTPYGSHVRGLLGEAAKDPAAVDTALAVALGARPEALVGGADVDAFYRDGEYRARWDSDVQKRIRSASTTSGGGGGGGGTAGGGGGGGGGGRR